MSSCRTAFIPLKGDYPIDYVVNFDKPAEEVITDIIDYCIENNIPLKTIDRKSGLIMSEPYKIKSYTFENTDGKPKDSNAITILGREGDGPKSAIDDPYDPKDIYADIVFIVKEEDNKTSMSIRLANMVAYFYSDWCMKEVKSTGFLEKQIIDRMK